jgi:hypothetical protein
VSENSSQAAVMNFLRAEFRREQKSDFALLRRIPSTGVRRFLDYFLALNELDKDTFSEALVQIALCLFFSNAPHPGKSGNAALKRYINELSLTWDWKYQSVRTLRMILAEAEENPDSRFARAMTPEIRKMIQAIKPVKSTDIRKVVKLALSQLLVPLTITQKWQEWHYEGLYHNREICIAIDCGSRFRQLDYKVSILDKERCITLKDLNYERIMGLSSASWNCLEQSNLDQSIALLKDFVIYCAEIPSRLPVEYK